MEDNRTFLNFKNDKYKYLIILLVVGAIYFNQAYNKSKVFVGDWYLTDDETGKQTTQLRIYKNGKCQYWVWACKWEFVDSDIIIIEFEGTSKKIELQGDNMVIVDDKTVFYRVR